MKRPRSTQFCLHRAPRMRIAIRGFIAGVRQFEECLSAPADGAGLENLAEEHARRMLALPGGTLHHIEIEFLDEPDPMQRFFRFGTDPRYMVAPIGIEL
jgi:hypothetical protein